MMQKFLIKGLSQLDAAELKEHLKSYDVDQTQSDRSPDTHHELGMAILLLAAVTGPALGVLAAWLLKQRQVEEFKVELEVVRDDGTRESLTITSKSLLEQAPDKDVLQKISALTKVPLEEIVKVTTGVSKLQE